MTPLNKINKEKIDYKIPHFGLARQYLYLKEELLEATDKVLKSGRLVSGPETHKFEEWLCLRAGTWYAVTCSSGTQALEIMAHYEFTSGRFLLNNKSDSAPTILIPNITYPATLNAFLNAGWNVEIGDTDKNGQLVFNKNYHLYHSDQKKYICYVGLYGGQLDHLFSANAFIDGAQHWLVADKNIGLGMSISFDPTKNLSASGDGGAIVTNNEELYKYALNYRDNGKYYDHVMTGTNCKMSELNASHLLVKTNYIDRWQNRRKKIRNYYIERLQNLPLRCLSQGFDKHADQKFVIMTENRDELHSYMTDLGIETKIHYKKTLGELDVSKHLKSPDMISTSLMLSRRVLSLPIYPELTDGEIDVIVERLKKFYDK